MLYLTLFYILFKHTYLSNKMIPFYMLIINKYIITELINSHNFLTFIMISFQEIYIHFKHLYN